MNKLIHESIDSLINNVNINEKYGLPNDQNTKNYVISKKLSGKKCYFVCIYDHYTKSIQMFSVNKYNKKINFIYPYTLDSTIPVFIQDSLIDESLTQVLFIFDICCVYDHWNRCFTNVILEELGPNKLFNLQLENEIDLCSKYNLVKRLYKPYVNNLSINDILNETEEYYYNPYDGVEIYNLTSPNNKYYYVPKEYHLINFFILTENHKNGNRYWKLFLRNNKNQKIFYHKLSAPQNFPIPPNGCIVSCSIEKIFDKLYFIPRKIRRDLTTPSKFVELYL